MYIATNEKIWKNHIGEMKAAKKERSVKGRLKKVGVMRNEEN